MRAPARDGRNLRLLILIDEYTRECPVIRVARSLGSQVVIEKLANVMLEKGFPEHLRSDTHLGLGKGTPNYRSRTIGSGRVVSQKRLGGLHHRYDRVA